MLGDIENSAAAATAIVIHTAATKFQRIAVPTNVLSITQIFSASSRIVGR